MEVREWEGRGGRVRVWRSEGWTCRGARSEGGRRGAFITWCEQRPVRRGKHDPGSESEHAVEELALERVARGALEEHDGGRPKRGEEPCEERAKEGLGHRVVPYNHLEGKGTGFKDEQRGLAKGWGRGRDGWCVRC